MQKKFIKWLRIFGIFLVFMWVCTIISKSIYVSKLTSVKTEQPSSRYIEHIVETEGIVTAGGEIAVNTLSGLRVSKINVRQGDSVKKGDILFTIDLDDLQDIISEKEAELTKLQLQLADINFNNILESQKKEIAVLWAEEDYESADNDTALAVERAQENLTKAENELQKHLETAAPYTSDEERKKAWDKYNNWKKRYYELQDLIADKEKEISELESNMENKNTDNENAGGEITVEENTNEQISDSDKQNELNKAYEELENLKKELTELDRNSVSQPDYTSEESEYDAWQSKKSSLEDTVQTAKQSLEDVTRTRESTLRQKKRNIASAEVLSNSDSTNQVYELEISEIQRKIAALQEIKNENGNITAKNEGYVSNVQILTGGRTADSAAILLIDETSNWQFSFSISSEQAKFIHLNDTLKLTLNGQPEMEVTADYLDSNSQGGYNILCQIPKGNGYPGTSGNIKKVVQGQLQTLTVPIDALHVEQNATYVYTLNERAGILGNEYYVEKLKVQVADKNDIYAAIESGVISKDTEIIIYSGKELEQGEVVRVNN